MHEGIERQLVVENWEFLNPSSLSRDISQSIRVVKQRWATFELHGSRVIIKWSLQR